MSNSKAQVKGGDTYISIMLGKQSVSIYEGDFKGLIDEYTTKERFVTMAEDMVADFIKMEGYDWDYDSRELQRRLAIIFDNII